MDITRTFLATNSPLVKLGHPEMKEFFAKYLAQFPLVHPNNYCGTWLPKVGSDQRVRIERIFRKREHFVVIFIDESDDPRPTEGYQLAINVLLLPKVFNSESAGEMAFHLDLKFPGEVNATTVSDAIDAICRDFHVEQSNVRLFVHDSPPYMVADAERFKFAKGYSNCVHLPCWPHLFAKMLEVVFDGACLPELKEFCRLTQLLFENAGVT